MPTTVLVRGREVHHVLIGRRNLGDVGEPISTWNWRQCMVHMAAIWRLGNHNLSPDHLLCLAMSFSLCCYFQIICQSLKPLFISNIDPASPSQRAKHAGRPAWNPRGAPPKSSMEMCQEDCCEECGCKCCQTIRNRELQPLATHPPS